MASGSCVVLDKQAAQPPVTTVNGTAVTLFSYLLLGGTLRATDEIWVQTAFKHITGNTSTTYAFAFGSASLEVNTPSGSGTSDVHRSGASRRPKENINKINRIKV